MNEGLCVTVQSGNPEDRSRSGSVAFDLSPRLRQRCTEYALWFSQQVASLHDSRRSYLQDLHQLAGFPDASRTLGLFQVWHDGRLPEPLEADSQWILSPLPLWRPSPAPPSEAGFADGFELLLQDWKYIARREGHLPVVALWASTAQHPFLQRSLPSPMLDQARQFAKDRVERFAELGIPPPQPQFLRLWEKFGPTLTKGLRSNELMFAVGVHRAFVVALGNEVPPEQTFVRRLAPKKAVDVLLHHFEEEANEQVVGLDLVLAFVSVPPECIPKELLVPDSWTDAT